MVLGVKKTIQQVPSRGRISIMRIQHFTIERRQSVLRAVYGALLIAIVILTASLDPISIATNMFLKVNNGSFLFKLYEVPPYDLYCEVWVFNYTNMDEYTNGKEKTIRLQEVGPFMFKEIRTNENMTVDPDRGVLGFNPKIGLEFIEEKSVAHYKDVQFYVPNLALLAMSTLLADKFAYAINVGAYYSMKGIGSKLFVKINGEQLFWGYNEPVVTLANTFLPGWINFGKIGIMDRFYAQRHDYIEVELKNQSTKYSINSFNHSPGLKEQGYTNTSANLCNTIKGSYEGLLVTPPLKKDKIIPFFRRQACRIIPMEFLEEENKQFGFNTYRYGLQKSAFNNKNPYACPCSGNEICLPDGFIDVSNCYYGFPIALSKPHFADVDPKEILHYTGMNPNQEKFKSSVQLEPTLGVPLSLRFNIQVNIAVRMSPGNTIIKPLAGKVVPLIWISLVCKEPPPDVVNILRLRLVIGPPILITVEVILFLIGMVLGIQGFRRILKPKYRLIDPPRPSHKEEDICLPKRKKSIERRLSTVILNMTDNIGFNKDDDELAKQAVSLLSISEEDNEAHDLYLDS